MKEVVVRAAAERDIAEILGWYKANAPEMVAHFLSELDWLLARLAIFPSSFPVVRRRTRRAMFRRFPYALFFVIGFDQVEVMACLHLRRDPALWRRH